MPINVQHGNDPALMAILASMAGQAQYRDRRRTEGVDQRRFDATLGQQRRSSDQTHSRGVNALKAQIYQNQMANALKARQMADNRRSDSQKMSYYNRSLQQRAGDAAAGRRMEQARFGAAQRQDERQGQLQRDQFDQDVWNDWLARDDKSNEALGNPVRDVPMPGGRGGGDGLGEQRAEALQKMRAAAPMPQAHPQGMQPVEFMQNLPPMPQFGQPPPPAAPVKPFVPQPPPAPVRINAGGGNTQSPRSKEDQELVDYILKSMKR